MYTIKIVIIFNHKLLARFSLSYKMKYTFKQKINNYLTGKQGKNFPKTKKCKRVDGTQKV